MALPPAHVVPAPELIADFAESADRFKPECFVKVHAGVVWQGDGCEGSVKAMASFGVELTEQRLVQRSRNATPMRVFGNVDRGFYRRPVGGAQPQYAGVGIAQTAVIGLSNNEGVVGTGAFDAFRHCLRRRYLGLEGNGRLFDDRAVDRQYR